MEALEDVNRLLAYYQRSGAPDKMLAQYAYKILGRFKPEERERAIDWLIENRPKKDGLDVPTIRTALSETGTKNAAYIPAVDVKCEACGMGYKYIDQPTEDDKHDRGLFDLCPRCGFQFCWTNEVDRTRTVRNFGILWEPAWYTRLKKQCLEAHSAGNNPHYNRRENDAFDAANKKAKNSAIVSESVTARMVI
jgi:hypothetical protein